MILYEEELLRVNNTFVFQQIRVLIVVKSCQAMFSSGKHQGKEEERR
jgi:hypothetical protein